MINAYEFYQAVLDKVNKPENGYIDHELFNRKTNNVMLGYFKHLINQLQLPETSNKAAIRDQLSPFVERVVLASDNGIVTRPENYEFFSSLRARFDGGLRAIELANLYSQLCEADTDPSINVLQVSDKIKDMLNSDHFVYVDLLDHQKVGRRLSSKIPGKRPHLGKPIAEQTDKGFELYPKDLASVRLVYYRTPKEGKLAMKVNPDTEGLEYDDFNSRHWEWTKASQNDLVILVAQDAGVFTRERDLIQMTEFQKTSG